MFKIDCQFPLMIEDCPKSGVEAIDWRRANGLPWAANNWIQINVQRQEQNTDAEDREDVCRKVVGLLNENANLVVTRESINAPAATEPSALAYRLQAHAGAVRCDRYGDFVPAPATLIAQVLADWRALPRLLDWMQRFASIQHLHAAHAAAIQRAAVVEDAAKREAEAAARKAAVEAEKAEEVAGAERLKLWALKNGSELTRARLAEGFGSWVASAHDDFYAAEHGKLKSAFPVAADEDLKCDVVEDRLSPTLPELEAWRAVRKLAPLASSRLVRCKYIEDDEPRSRTEIEVAFTGPDGYKAFEYYLIPEGVCELCGKPSVHGEHPECMIAEQFEADCRPGVETGPGSGDSFAEAEGAHVP